MFYPKSTAVCTVESIKKGEQIAEKHIEERLIGKWNLSENIITSSFDVIGRYAAIDIVSDDMLLFSKLSQLPLDGDHPKDILPVGNTSMLITIKMIEGSEHPMPETGDIVKLSLFKDKLLDIPELQFVRILSVLPVEQEIIRVTISVNAEQEKYIRKHSDEVFFSSVIVRNNEELAEKLLEEQSAFWRKEK
ncbi:MAG: hypothetical protein Q4A54_06565 [Parabacteroides sp.]|nr:hypothetical protein [Parabacteroides sp.]